MLLGVLPAFDASAAGHASGQEIVDLAMTYLGKVPYVWGGTKIDGANPGADCSGFICRLYEKFGFNFWANRTKLRNCGTNLGADLSLAELGDIIWYEGHVAIFAGYSNGHPMIVHCTGGNVQNVTYSRADRVSAALKGVIRIPGVVNGGQTLTKAYFSAPTQRDYVNKAWVGETNAVLVTQVSKLSGVKVTQMGICIYDANGELIKKYSENVSGLVGNSTTVYHSWYDMNSEAGITLEPGTDYKYRFFGVFDGQEIMGDVRLFTTAGQKPAKTFRAYFYSGLDYMWYDVVEVTQGKTFPFLPANPYVPEGYSFKGWFTAKSGGEQISANTVFNGNGDVSFYAQYEKKAETATAYLYSGLDYSQCRTITVTEGRQLGIMPEAYVPEGYTFKGWFTAKSGGEQLSPATIYNGGGDLFVYAQYEEKVRTYTARFYSGLNFEYCEEVCVAYNEALGKLPEAYVPEGYNFWGWYTAMEGGAKIGSGTVYDVERDYSFYARYESNMKFEPDFHRIMLWINYPNMSVDGSIVPIDAQGTMPSIINGRTMLPIRAVMEAMGGSVAWDNSTKTITLSKDGEVLKLRIGSSYAWDSERAYALDSAPVIIGGRTLLPVRAVVEYFHGIVEWDNSAKCVTISYEDIY